MIRPSTRRRFPARPPRRGFTLVELLVVFIVLAILIAILLPAINGAVRTARNSAAATNLKQLDQALAAFKSRHGEYPPSRILVCEDGFYPTSSTVALATATGQVDQTLGQLAQRSLGALRKIFPKVNFSTSGVVWKDGDSQWYDFNGNGLRDFTPYVLQGHQCLVFFLGGLPYVSDDGTLSVTGLAKNPANPFIPSVAPVDGPSTFVSNNREQPLFEFGSTRLAIDPNWNPALSPQTSANLTLGFPGYVDALGNKLGTGQINFIAYFSSYGNNAYDPNDVNFPTEETDYGTSPISAAYSVRFPVRSASAATTSNLAISPSPNPYTNNVTNHLSVPGTVNYVNPQTYQLISSGADGLFGPGGQFSPSATASPLPFNAADVVTNPDTAAEKAKVQSIRAREKDNITNFHGGRLD